MDRIKEECLKFGESVSVRGIPKAIRSKRTLLKVMWLVSVLVSSGVLAWQLYTLFYKVHSYPYSTAHEESTSSNVFPDINICNLHPKVSGTGINYDEFLRYEEYREKIADLISQIGETTFRALDPNYANIDDLLDSLPTFYFNSLPKTFSRSDYTIPTLTYYRLWETSGEVIRNRDCLLENAIFWDIVYYNCFTFRISPACTEPISKLTMVVYTNSMAYSQEQFEENFLSVETNGVKVILSPPGRFGDFSRGFNLGSGTDNVVNMEMVVRSRLGRPFNANGCHASSFLNDSSVDLNTFVSCVGNCVQNAVLAGCDCLSPDCYLPRYMQKFNVCGNTTLTCRSAFVNQSSEYDLILNAASEMICKDKITDKSLYDECSNNCQQPCNETYYDFTIHSIGDWPHFTYYSDFFAKFIEPYLNQSDAFATYYKPYLEIRKRFHAKNITSDEFNNFIKNSKLLSSNFLQVSFQFKNSNPTVIRDYPEYTWESILSLVGGSFSLWLGVTIMTVVEILEFIINIGFTLKETVFYAKSNNLECKSPDKDAL